MTIYFPELNALECIMAGFFLIVTNCALSSSAGRLNPPLNPGHTSIDHRIKGSIKLQLILWNFKDKKV